MLLLQGRHAQPTRNKWTAELHADDEFLTSVLQERQPRHTSVVDEIMNKGVCTRAMKLRLEFLGASGSPPDSLAEKRGHRAYGMHAHMEPRHLRLRSPVRLRVSCCAVLHVRRTDRARARAAGAVVPRTGLPARRAVKEQAAAKRSGRPGYQIQESSRVRGAGGGLSPTLACFSL